MARRAGLVRVTAGVGHAVTAVAEIVIAVDRRPDTLGFNRHMRHQRQAYIGAETTQQPLVLHLHQCVEHPCSLSNKSVVSPMALMSG